MKHLLTLLLVCAFFATTNAQSSKYTCCYKDSDIIQRSNELKTECCTYVNEAKAQTVRDSQYCYILQLYDVYGRITQSIIIYPSQRLKVGAAEIIECN